MSVVALVENGAALLSMRNSDFDAYSAYGEVIDNSIQADADEIRVRFDYLPKSAARKREALNYVAFGDNGKGMDAELLHRCLQLGYSSRYNDRSGIGRFGVGAILAAINQCKKVEVYSREKGREWLYTYVDLDEITSEPPKMTGIPDPMERTPPDSLLSLVNGEHGTLVIWSKYDRQPVDATEIIDEFGYWAGRTYRKFIWEGVNIVVNGNEVKAVDPLYVTTKSTRYPEDPEAVEYDPIVIDWPVSAEDSHSSGVTSSKITIRLSLLPEVFRPNQGAGGTKDARNRYIDRNDGVSIMRNGREVFFGRIPYWPGKPFQEIDRWWGCEISFDAVLDSEFTVKNIKRGAVPVKELKKLIAEKIEPTRHTALEKVREVWRKAKTESMVTGSEDIDTTAHADAERTAKETKLPKNQIDKDKDRDQELNRYTEDWLKHADEVQKASWRAKFEGQPFTIVDDEWRGPEFFETAHLGGSSVLKYNMRHSFFDLIEEIRLTLETEDADNLNARKLKALIDLLLISYAKSEAMMDPGLEMSADRFIEQLRMGWGNYLASYIETFNKEWSDLVG